MMKYFINFNNWAEFHSEVAKAKVVLVETDNIFEYLKELCENAIPESELDSFVEKAIMKGYADKDYACEYTELTVLVCTDKEWEVLKRFIKEEKG